MLNLQDILNLKSDLFKNSKVKLVRHKDSRAEYRELLKDKNELLKYQKEQGKPIFHDCDYIISFIGQEKRKSIFLGVFKINGYKKLNELYYYDLEQLPEFNYLVNRIVIDWGGSAISWHQWYDKQPKEIIQILPQGYMGEFPGLLNFVLNYDELKRLIENPDANEDWKNHLSAVNGIYLILDANTGEQYIGSAYGQGGIWQRWSNYVRTCHGGNQKLMKICSTQTNYHQYFRYSILQSLPSNITPKEIIKIENLYKEKLGTRAYGLNMN
jgi:hypothetical protein